MLAAVFLTFFAQRPEKILQQRPAFFLQHTSFDLALMVKTFILEQVHQRTSRPAFQVGCTIIDFLDPRQQDRAAAHRARLQGHIELRFLEPPILLECIGLPDRCHFRMRRRIIRHFAFIVAAPDDFTFPDDHRSDRHFPYGRSLFRLLDGFPHVLFLQLIHLPIPRPLCFFNLSK
ncbi:hypothetical protein SDC9_78756 [bioreactor metagenome]|uniref:Uncharacterized protein n=1 Tax=bioreactor metagenome TaxID=1076179 RepID=A0A644YV33_9ZZZZ